MYMLMMKVIKRRHIEVQRATNSRIQLTIGLCIKKLNGVLQRQVWGPSKLNGIFKGSIFNDT